MVPLVMIMNDELGEGPAQMPLAERNRPIEALRFDRTDEAFGLGVGIRRLIR
jgi:hypothetical protein